jgi:DNA-binding Lrp family transcriptional regulator
MLDSLDEKIIAALQDEFPLMSRPYYELAAKIGISEEELLSRLKEYRRSGVMRRMGAVLRHREIGYAANALCAWVVSCDRLDEVAAQMAGNPAVTHCYARLPAADWPYNFYIMLHGKSRPECETAARRLSAAAGLGPGLMLFSSREWKKTSMRYFGEGDRHDQKF